MCARTAGRQRCKGRGRGQDRGVSWCEAMTAWLVHGQQIGSSSMFWQRQQPGRPSLASNSPSAAARRPMQCQQHKCNTSKGKCNTPPAAPGWISCISAASSWSKLTDARAADKGMQVAAYAYNEENKCERHSVPAGRLHSCRLCPMFNVPCAGGWLRPASQQILSQPREFRSISMLTRLNVEGHARP